MSQSAKFIAVGYLARRDYSRKEIKSKLLLKDFDIVEVEQVLDYCEVQGYLSDERYAASLVRSHVNKGHGTMRITQALAQKGLSKDYIQEAINQSDCDWFELAKQKAIKKYGDPCTSDLKEKAKRVRFLIGQGFSFDQVAYALSYDPYDE